MAHDVTDPSGQGWRVKRRWLPWHLCRRDPDLAADLADGFHGVRFATWR